MSRLVCLCFGMLGEQTQALYTCWPSALPLNFIPSPSEGNGEEDKVTARPKQWY